MIQNDLHNYLGIDVVVEDPPTDEDILQKYMPCMWIEDKKNRYINEHVFADTFIELNHLQYNNGLFYSKEGRKTDDTVASTIASSIREMGIYQDVERTTKKLLGAVKLTAHTESLDVDPNLIPFANGDFDINKWQFHMGSHNPSPYRLKADLPLEFRDTPNFLKWLKDLFYEEDIMTIQEYLGYCLVPSTKAQKALFLVGEGGAGKSVLGVILEAILGEAMLSTSSTQEFLQDKFKLAELEHKLVLYDDDLDSEALSGTGMYKKLITNTLAVTADRKYGQPFKFTPSIKLVSCCNEMLSSKYDNTEGFYRRLLPIVIKPISKDFKPDLQFYDKIRAEAEGILQWSLFGLRRLILNGWVLTESDRTKAYVAQKRGIGNHFPDFMESVFEFDPSYEIPTTEILSAYQVWCRKNACDALKSRTVQGWLSDNAEKYGLERSRTVRSGDTYVRGYKGLRVRENYSNKGLITLK